MNTRALSTGLVVSLLTIACAKSGGAPVAQAQALQEMVSFGLVRGDQPTTRTVNITKPFVPPAEVELVETPAGAFAPAPNALPVTAGKGTAFGFQVTFTPPAGPPPAGPVTGRITVRFLNAGGAEQSAEILLSATIESPDITLVMTTLDFGRVAVGEIAESSVVVQNPNAATPVTVTAVTGLGGAFQLGSGNSFPRTVLPGSSLAIVVSFSPAAVGPDASGLSVENSVKAPLPASINGEGMPGEVVVHDFVSFPLDLFGETDVIDIDVPPEAISVSILAVDVFGGLVDIISLTGPDGTVYTDNFDGRWIWFSGFPAGFDGVLAAQLPNDDDREVKLVRGGGKYEIRLATSSLASEIILHVVVEQRFRGQVRNGRIPVAVFVADGLPLDETTAAADPKLTEALATMDAILAQIGLRVGEVSYHKLTDPFWDVIDTLFALQDLLEFGPLFSNPAPPPGRLNLYFVNGLEGTFDGFIGVAGALPGFKIDLTPYSGVVMEYDGQDAFTLGSTSAHEVGHFLALEHTVEDDGSFFGLPDFIADTLWCLPFGTDEICPIEGANYLMHWADLGREGIVVTRGQGQVMLRHVMVEPGHPATSFPTRAGIPTPVLRQGFGQMILRTKLPSYCANCAGAYPAQRR